MASIAEVKTAALPVNTVTNIPLDTTLVASDVIFVVCYGFDSSQPSIAISGVTLSNPLSGDVKLGSDTHVARWGTGATGSKTVAITQGTSVAGRAIVYVIRGLNSATLDDFQKSAYTSSNVASVSTPSFLVEPGQVVIFCGLFESNNISSAVTATHPASGWRADSSDTSMRGYAHAAIASAGSTVGTASAPTAGARGIFGVVFGTADAAAPPLTSTFVGWGNPIF